MKETAENIITTELAKQNVTEAVIAKLKTDYLPLKINGIDDTEGYKKVHDARIVCRDHRTLAERICKAGREDAVKEQKAWIAKEKEVVALISEVEQHLKKQEDAIDDQKEAIKIRAERLLKLPGRKEQLVGLDEYISKVDVTKTIFAFNEIGKPLTDEAIMRCDDNQWNQFILGAKEKKFDAQQKVIDDAKALAHQNTIVERTNALYKIGVIMVLQYGVKNFKKGNISATEDEIAEMENEVWEQKYAEFYNVKGETPVPEMKDSVTAQIEPRPGDGGHASDFLTDEEKLWNYATALEKVEWPGLKSEEATETFEESQKKLQEVLTILRS